MFSGPIDLDELEEIEAQLAQLPKRKSPSRESALPPRLRALDNEISAQKSLRLACPEVAEPQMIGRFEGLEWLGEGGYGIVFLARDHELDRNVALKVCPTARRSALEAFMREAQILAKFSHPNIVSVYETGRYGEDFFYVMEFIEGRDGYKFIKLWRRWEEVLDVYEAAAAGLAAAHDKGIVHRDFKPANILRGSDGRVCVADFGIAQLIDDGAPDGDPTAESHRLGTLPYMAPEVLRGEAGDARADQWSFCVALWETLERRLPFEGKTVEGLVASIEGGELRVLESAVPVPAGLRLILRRGLSVDPAERFPDMHAVILALGELRRPPPQDRRGWWPRSKPPRGVFLVAMLMGVGAVLGAAGWEHLRSSGEGGLVEIVPPAPMSKPAPPCATMPSGITVDPVVRQVCVLIREGNFEDADALWVLVHADRREESSGVEDMSADDWLANDILTIARTFVDQAEAIVADNPAKARAAAEVASRWAALAANNLALGKQDGDVMAVEKRARHVARITSSTGG